MSKGWNFWRVMRNGWGEFCSIWLLSWALSGKRGKPMADWLTNQEQAGSSAALFLLPGSVGAVVGSHCDVTEELPLGLLTARICEGQPCVKWRHSAPDMTPIWLFSLVTIACTHIPIMFTPLEIMRSIWWHEKNSSGLKGRLNVARMEK